MLLHYLGKLKIQIFCRYSADMEENANKLHFECTDFNSIDLYAWLNEKEWRTADLWHSHWDHQRLAERRATDSTVSAQRQCCACLCHGVRRRGRSADCQAKRPRTPFCRKEDKVSGRLRELLKQNLSAFHASSTVRVCQLLCTAPFETFQTQVLTVIRDTDDRWMRVICGSAACSLDSTLNH